MILKRAKSLEIAKSNDKFIQALNENPDPLILAEWNEEKKIWQEEEDLLLKKNSFYSSSQIEIPSPEAEEDLDLKISTIDTNFTWG